MSFVSKFPRIPVRTKSLEEGVRRAADGINYILHLLDHVITVAAEVGYFSGLTTPYDVLGDAPITNWDMAGRHASDETELDIDGTTGEVTIAVRGIYRIEGNFIGTGTTNNITHTINVDYDAGGVGSWGASYAIGSFFKTNLAALISITGFMFFLLEAGDKIRFAHTSSSGIDTFTVTTAQAAIRLMKDDHV